MTVDTLASPSPSASDIVDLPLAEIGERFGALRIIDPKADAGVRRSMERYGQIMPVVVSGKGGRYDLLDGFKRLRAARALCLPSLRAQVMVVNRRAGKAALIQLNRRARSISALEEALVVHSLCREDGLSQAEIAILLGRHKSWVCRRIALMDRLCDEALEQIRLGLVPVSSGRDLVRLPRGNQPAVLHAITSHRLTCRETKRLVDTLLTRPEKEHPAILAWPRRRDDIPEQRKAGAGMSPAARLFHRELQRFQERCRALTALLATVDAGRFADHDIAILRRCCRKTATLAARIDRDLGLALATLQGDSP